ncbi:nitrate- and nitrite sensing domain-containing protein [Streptomyces sp. NBC_00059]|uniref:sensor histidine kinase n=1 Tax=Streptomyces sp. NBC_00059 TaxID=2975635 RepID=UPI0022575132|nr:nitrate- and nitrite sensing domain-containing protein [Streptomyces sp. NBC_00059]MCX5417244.1 nitrate- and nitrite sensing domain-containing protein [Streptomyces sp. NBC_00059]
MSLRTALLVLAIVPGVALAALWAVTSGQTLLDFQRQAAQGLLAEQAGQPSNIVYYNLQEERRLSAEALARPGDSTTALKQQRTLTDEAIKTFQSLSDVTADDAPEEVREAVGKAREAINQLPAQRSLVDEGDGDQQAVVYGYYTDLIAVDLKLFAALSHVDNGEVTTLGQPLVDLFWAKEMISRSDAILARGWPTGKLSTEDLQEVRKEVSGQAFQAGTKVVPYLPEDERDQWQKLTESSAWAAKTEIEEQVLRPAEADRSGFVALDADEKAWRKAMDGVTPQLVDLLEQRTDAVMVTGKGTVMSLLTKMIITSVVGLLAVIAVVWTTWRLTRNLRRRISGLQERAEELEKALPDVVDRLAQGEKIDVEAEARAIETPREGGDELTRLGSALNQARTSALQAAVKQADQHRGFERLLQRIARRTQQLIGQQLKKLDELERKHEDPEVLDGLFDLDHLTARLRRYEENLVILAGGSPHRRWRKPVPLLDVMRSAQGEVQDYRRVVLDLDGAPWLAERAVGPVSHVLAELIENALSFSRPPSPVEVRAAKVSRGLAIEVEDRGLGMEEEQLAEANELMSRPPRMDVLAHSEDIRLGLYVISRLADQYGLRVEFRPSAFGGTRVVVLVPDALTVPEPGSRPAVVPSADPSPVAEQPPVAVPEAPGALPTRVQGRAMAGVTALADHAARTRTPEQERPVPEQPYGGSGDPFPVPGQPFPPDGQPFPADGQPYPPDGQPYTPGAAPYAEADQTYATGEADQTYTAADSAYPAPEQPYAEAGRPYATAAADQTYTTAVPAYPAPEQPYAEGPYPGSGQPYAGQEQPYMTAAGQYPVPGHAYAEPAEEYPAPEPSYPQAYPAPDETATHAYGAAGPETPPAAPLPALPAAGGEPPLPRRVRQASLVDELRVDPASRTAPTKPPAWDENPLLRPVPRRAGAAIGAFQRRSRAARAAEEPSGPAPTAPSPTREERS